MPRPSRTFGVALYSIALVLTAAACSSGDVDDVGSGAPSVRIEAGEVPVGTMVAQAAVPELVAYSEPDAESAPLVTMIDPTPIGGPVVLRVLTAFGLPTPEWLEVSLPVRPNGTVGWIRSDDVKLTMNPYRIDIDTSDFTLELFEGEALVFSTAIAVGTGDTPTPYGEFFLTELLQPSTPDGRYGPYAFGLSGFSDVLTAFRGGDGVIGIHGTDEPEALGTEVSHGCVRVSNDVITEMASIVPLGTPVKIEA